MERDCLLGILTSLNGPAQLCEIACFTYRSLQEQPALKDSPPSIHMVMGVLDIHHPSWLD